MEPKYYLFNTELVTAIGPKTVTTTEGTYDLDQLQKRERERLHVYWNCFHNPDRVTVTDKIGTGCSFGNL